MFFVKDHKWPLATCDWQSIGDDWRFWRRTEWKHTWSYQDQTTSNHTLPQRPLQDSQCPSPTTSKKLETRFQRMPKSADFGMVVLIIFNSCTLRIALHKNNTIPNNFLVILGGWNLYSICICTWVWSYQPYYQRHQLVRLVTWPNLIKLQLAICFGRTKPILDLVSSFGFNQHDHRLCKHLKKDTNSALSSLSVKCGQRFVRCILIRLYVPRWIQGQQICSCSHEIIVQFYYQRCFNISFSHPPVGFELYSPVSQ